MDIRNGFLELKVRYFTTRNRSGRFGIDVHSLTGFDGPTVCISSGFPISRFIMIQNFDCFQPFAAFIPPQIGYNHPQRSPILFFQRFSAYAPDQHGRRTIEIVERHAGGIYFRAVKQRMCRMGCNFDLRQKIPPQNPIPIHANRPSAD